MAEITKALSIDVARANVFQAVVAKQNDSNSRFLEVTIMNEGTPIEIAQNSTVTINAAREDGNSKSFLGTVGSDGKVVVPLTNWMLALDGNVRCDITIVDSENRKLTTTSFMIAVEEATYLGTDISEDEDYDLLTQLLTDCTTAKAACEAAAAQANSAVGNLDSTIEEKISELQPALTFDTTPTQGSTNPVTSDGVWNTWVNLENTMTSKTQSMVGKKVDKETGKSLSTNDYTDAEKQKNADNESHIGKLSELSDRMYSSTPESLVDAINTMVDVVKNKADKDYVGVQKIENNNNSVVAPWSWIYLGVYYVRGKFSLPTSQGSYTYTFDNLVDVRNDGVQNYQLTVYEKTGITILTFGNDSTEVEKKTYRYDQFITATDYASADRTGVVRIDPSRGVCISPTDHVLYVKTLDTVDIGTRSSTIGTLSMDMLNTAVKAALTDSNRISGLTDSEKENARNTIGAERQTMLSYPVTSDITLNDKTDIRIPVSATTINLALPATIYGSYECAFTFKSGDTATTLTYPGDSLKFVGVDCDENGDFIPTANRNYEVVIKNLSTLISNTVLVARVGVY